MIKETIIKNNSNQENTRIMIDIIGDVDWLFIVLLVYSFYLNNLFYCVIYNS